MFNLWPWKGRRLYAIAAGWALSLPLAEWSGNDVWTLGNAVEGTLVLGATGSGKSTGSGRTIARSFLRAGFGGLVLTAKKDERQLWEAYCKETGRLSDLVVFAPDGPWRYNFLDAELQHRGSGAGLTENIVNLFSTVLEIAERGQGGGGREDEGYWRRALRQLLRNVIDLLVFATGRLSIPDLYRVVISAPTSIAEKNSAEWKSNSFCFDCLSKADKASKTAAQAADFEIVADYFLVEYPNLSEKTRSVVVSTFTSMVDVLNRGILRQLFCTTTNLSPAATEQGKIILIDLPVKEYREVGLFAQVLWKYAFQMAAERRNINANPRPIFLWADEAQNFVTSFDQQFQTTCRAARVATVLLSQNISNFYAALGGNEKARVEVDSLFANLNTKILHANGDAVTNEWAARLIGRCRQFFLNASNSEQQANDWMGFLPGGNESGQNNAGISESYEFEVQPAAFTALRTGGMKYKGLVDAIVFQNGTTFQASGRTWLQTTFRQQLS
jgi:type IV secretory pathway TraG/TraD family ATPase VirD4